jgi:predicted RNA-binding Zn ribbon-like protein
MTGERQDARAGASPQPGGRAPAPGRLALVQAFINTHYDLEEVHGAEVFSSVGALGSWLRRAGLLDGDSRLGEPDLTRARALREGLRALAQAGSGPGRATVLARERVNAVAAGGRLEVRFTAEGPRLIGTPDAGLDSAVGSLLAIVAQAMTDGSWSRLKVCPGHHCGWAFYDHSRNRSGVWCSMSVCGGRQKARAHYRRRRTERDRTERDATWAR